MLTRDHDINLYSPDGRHLKVIAYPWMFEGERIMADYSKCESLQFDNEVSTDREVIDFLLELAEEDYLGEEFDWWYGGTDILMFDSAPAILRAWAKSLPEYEVKESVIM